MSCARACSHSSFATTACLLTIGLSASAADAALKTWDGGAGTSNWSDAANWAPDGVPGPADDAVIDVVGSISVNVNGGASVLSLTCAETLVLNSSLTLGAPSTISGAFDWNSGTLTGAMLTVNGSATIATGGNHILDRMTIQLGGAASWDGAGSLTFTDSGTATKSFVEILNGGSFTLPSISQNFSVAGSGHAITVNGGGTLTKPGTGTFTHNIAMTAFGSIVVTGGSLDLTGGGANFGSFDATGGQCRFQSAYSHQVGVSLTGNCRFTSGVQTLMTSLTDPATNLTIEGATVSNEFPHQINGTVQWTSGTLTGNGPLYFSSLTLTSGGNHILDRKLIRIDGSGSWDGAGAFTFTDSSTATKSFLEINSGASFTLPSVSQNYNVAGAGHAVNNAGTLVKPGGGTFTHNILLNNAIDAAVVVEGGSLDLNTGGSDDGAFTVTGGQCRFLNSFTHSATAVLTGNNRFTGGTQTLLPGVTINNVTIDGAFVSNSSAVTIGGSVQWLSGTLQGDGPLQLDGVTALTTGGNKILDRKTLRIGGDASWDGTGAFTFTDSSTATKSFLEINSGASFTLPAVSQNYNVAGAGHAVNNAGTLVKPGGGTFTHNILLNNAIDAAVVVEGGSLDLNTGGSDDGAFTVTGGQCRFLNSFTHSATAVLTGNNRFTGGTQTLLPGVTINNVTIDGAFVSNSSAVTIGGSVQWLSGTLQGDGPLQLDGVTALTTGGNKILDRKTLRIGGDASWDGTGAFTFTDSGTITKCVLEILDTGSFALPLITQNYSVSGAGHQVINEGLLSKAGDFTFTHNLPLINNGTLLTTAGILIFNAGGTNNGEVLSPTGTTRYSSNVNHTGNANMSGDIRFASGTQTLEPGVAIASFVIEGATVSNADPVTLANCDVQWLFGTLLGAPLTLDAGSTLSLTTGGNKILDRKTLRIGGDASWDGTGAFTFTDSSTATKSFLEINSGASFTLPAVSQNYNVAGAGHAVNNAGTLVKPGGGTFTHNILLNNAIDAAVVVEGGSLDLNTGGSDDGAFTVTGGQCRFLNSFTHSATAVLTGNNRFTGGTQTLLPGVTINNVTIDGAFVSNSSAVTIGGSVQWLSGTLQGDGPLQLDGVTALTTGGNKILDRKTLRIGGDASWDGTGAFTFTDSGTITKSFLDILDGGSFTLPAASQNYNVAGPGHAVNNAGTLVKQGGGTFTHNIALNNAGVVSIDSGTLATSSGYTQTAGSTVLNGGVLANGSAMALQGGLFKGNGTSSGSTNQTGGSITPGFSPGTISMGSLTQNASSMLDLELGGTSPGSQHDQLVVSGAASLAGTLRLTFINGFVPHTGDSFVVVSAGSRSGTFSTVDVTGYPDCVVFMTYTATQAIVKIETTPPVALCQALDVNLAPNGSASITAAQVDAGSSDNCAIDTMVVAPNTFDCSNLGTNIVTLTVTDLVGNVATCQSIVTVHDVTAPVITQFPANLNLQCTSLVAAANINSVAATDACGPVTITHQGDASNGGSACPASPLVLTRTYRATDGSGNFSEQTQVITVVDSTAPIIVAFPADQALQCVAELPPANVALVSATENCGGTPTITHVGDVSNGGAGCPASPLVITRTYRATDTCDNVVDQAQVFTIINDTVPTITAFPGDETLQCAAEIAAADVALVSATGHCGGVVTITHQGDASSGTGCPASPLVVTRTYRATDSCGNTTDQAQTFTVVDTRAPSIIAFPADEALQCPAEIPAPDIGVITATDGCGGIITITHQGDVDNGGSACPASPLVVTRTYRATDSCGNLSEHAQVFTVIDTDAPTIDAFPVDQSLQCAGEVPQPDTAVVIASDNCTEVVTITHEGDVDNGGSGCAASPLVITRTYRASDACGNFVDQSQVFTVVDDAPPSIKTCPAVQQAGINCQTIPLPDFTSLVVVVDNCDTRISIEQSPVVGTQLGIGVHTITLSMQDACGNIASCQSTFTVTTSCPADLNNDHGVAADDLAILLGAWGSCDGCCADFTDNGAVGGDDLAVLLGAWGPCPSGIVGAGDTSAGAPSETDVEGTPQTAAAGASKSDGPPSSATSNDESVSEEAPPRVVFVDTADGVLIIDGDLQLASNDRVVIQVRSAEPIVGCDLIVVTGRLQLDGILDVMFDEGFDATLAFPLPLIVAKELSGAFASIETNLDVDQTVTPSATNVMFSLGFEETTSAEPLMPEESTSLDVNGDGIVDVFDFVAVLREGDSSLDAVKFIRRWAALAPAQ